MIVNLIRITIPVTIDYLLKNYIYDRMNIKLRHSDL
jgi:hypothetical protein